MPRKGLTSRVIRPGQAVPPDDDWLDRFPCCLGTT
jgi:hypothetical protein